MPRTKGSKNKPKPEHQTRSEGATSAVNKHSISYLARGLETPYTVVVNGAINDEVALALFRESFPNADVVGIQQCP
jgi:hypothetical protein